MSAAAAPRSTDDPDDQQRQRRDQRQERLRVRNARARGTLFAHGHRLRHLDHAASRLDAVYLPATIGLSDVDSPSVVRPGSTACGRDR
jgi:hypothetical protein